MKQIIEKCRVPAWFCPMVDVWVLRYGICTQKRMQLVVKGWSLRLEKVWHTSPEICLFKGRLKLRHFDSITTSKKK